MTPQGYPLIIQRFLNQCNVLARERGLANKGFGITVNEETDKEYWLALCDKVIIEGVSRLSSPPTISDTRLIWTSKRLIQLEDYPLVLCYYVCSKGNGTIETLAYRNDLVHRAAEHAYDYLVTGNLPKLNTDNIH